MPSESSRTQTTPQRPPIRIEYLDHEGEDEYRQYRLALHSQEGRVEVRVRIPVAAFAANRVLLQDGPDVCYQRLLYMLSAGEAPGRDVIVIDGSELAAYREAHTPAPRRSVTPRVPHKRTPMTRTPVPDKRPKLPIATAAPPHDLVRGFAEGQRVSHATFGAGVTMGSTGGRTSVQFDDHGVRTFVTSMLELQLLSAPHEWEAGPRGRNRPRDTVQSGSASGKRRA